MDRFLSKLELIMCDFPNDIAAAAEDLVVVAVKQNYALVEEFKGVLRNSSLPNPDQQKVCSSRFRA
jgi:hypothetical protein